MCNTGYNTPEWKEKRLKILKRDKNICAICQRVTTNPHVHHISYLNSNDENTFIEPWKADDEQLITLCREHHDRFWGTQSKTKDYIILPTFPTPTLLKRHDQHPEHEDFWDILEIMIPDWDDEYEILLRYQYRNKNIWISTYKYSWKLKIAILYPEISKLWKKLYEGDTIEGKDEIEEFLFYTFYSPKEIEAFDREILKMVESCRSLIVNYNYMHQQFIKALNCPREKPYNGYVLITKNNKKERRFTLYNLSNKQEILLADFISDSDFKNVPITTINIIGALFAYKYIASIDVSAEYIDAPIFLANSSGIGSIRGYLYSDTPCFDNYFFEKEFLNIPERLRITLTHHLNPISSPKRCRVFEWNKEWGTWD